MTLVTPTIEERIYQRSPTWLRTVLMNAHGLRIAKHRWGARYRARLSEFARLSTASADELLAYRQSRLIELLRYAIEWSPAFAERRAIADGASISSSEELLASFPVLNKDLLRQMQAQLLTSAGGKDGWLKGSTSGTTGTPLSLYYSQEQCIATNAADRLQKRFAGLEDDEYIGMILGRQVVPSERSTPPFWHTNVVQRQVWYSGLHMTPVTLPAYIRDIRRKRLRALEGYPSTLYILARFLLANGETLPMKAVFSSSETLLDDQRLVIESAFETKLFDFYGHAERVIFAIECKEHTGKHLVEPFGITELVDEAGNSIPDGRSGFLTGTSLWNTAMPLVRYRTGDISAIDRTPCACGCTWPRIVGVSTKAEDMIVLADGRWLSPSAITHPFKPFTSIQKSQVIQEDYGTFTVRVVATDAFDAQQESLLVSRLRERLGSDVDIRVVREQNIAVSAAGKYRWVISKVEHSLRVNWT